MYIGLASSSRSIYATTPRRNRTRTGYRSQLRALVLAQRQFSLRSSRGHAGISRSIDTRMLREHRLVNNRTEY
ncbi:MAG: hypothetical protein VB124_03445 [Burkholderia sp.]